MQVNNIENRELRSFKLRIKTLTLKSFFEDKENLAIFMMSDSIQPQNRLEIRKYFAKHGLILTFLSKKMINLWMKESEWDKLKNLLSGNVVQIQIDSKSQSLSPEYIQNILKFLLQQSYLDLRCIIWNQQVYRKEKLNKFLELSVINPKETLVETTLQTPLLKSILFEGLFFARSHYKK